MTRHRVGPCLLVALLALAGCAAPAATTAPSPTVAVSATASATPSEAAAETASASSSAAPTTEALTSDPLHALTLVDVRSGESLTLGELAAEKPLLVETMAIWCTNCRSQMHQVTEAHGSADFHSLSIDVEPYEVPEDLAAYAAAEGFD